jgi:hypothetical protein
MKKIYALLCATFFSAGIMAQSQTELHIGLGIGSMQEAAVRNGTHPMIKAANTSAEVPTSTYSAAGPIRIGIKKHESKHFLIGAEFNYTNIEVTNTFESQKSEIVNFAHYTLLASTQYKYIDNPKLIIYSGVDFGVSFARVKNQEKDIKTDDLTVAFQLNALGARYGNKTGVFAEVGYGFNGFLSGGLFYRLD